MVQCGVRQRAQEIGNASPRYSIEAHPEENYRFYDFAATLDELDG